MRVLIADDHTLVRSGMRMLVESIPNARVVGEATDGLEALRLIETERPDVVLMDIAMSGLNGIEATRRAVNLFPLVRIIILSMHADEAYVEQALSAGAAGYLLKGADKSELEAAMIAVTGGRSYLSPAISRAVIAALARSRGETPRASPLAELTTRQVEVLRFVARGLSTKEIAATLGLSAKTVEAHRAAVMRRLGIGDVAGLVRFAIREGLVGASDEPG